MNESIVSIDLFTEAQSNKDNNYKNDTSINEIIPKKVGSPSMLDVVSVSDADDSIPIKETSQKTCAKGVVRLTKVRVQPCHSFADHASTCGSGKYVNFLCVICVEDHSFEFHARGV